MSKAPVHWCGHSGQPYVHIACLKRELYVWGEQADLPDGVYEADGDKGTDNPEKVPYTFDRNKVTCEICKPMAMRWTLDEGLSLIRRLESPLKEAGWAIGVTGSVLVRGQSDKDIDLVFYPMNNALLDREALYEVFRDAGMTPKFDSIQIHGFWRRAGSTDRKHVEVWDVADGRRVDVFILS